MNGDRIPKALESLRAAISSLRKANTGDPRKVISNIAAAIDATAHARDLLALEYESTLNHLHVALLRARERSPDRDPA